MSSNRSNPQRTIATDVVSACFGELSPDLREDLSISIVRQWLTNRGIALLMTTDHHFWLILTSLEDGQYQVVRDVKPNHFIEHMRRSRVLENEIPGLLHELNIRQVARCNANYGELLQLRVEPQQRRFHIELEPDQERNL